VMVAVGSGSAEVAVAVAMGSSKPVHSTCFVILSDSEGSYTGERYA